MSFGIFWKKNALQDLKKLGVFLKKRIIKKVMDFAENESFHEAKKVLGEMKIYRLRIGDFRVIFELNGKDIHILKIEHRKNIY